MTTITALPPAPDRGDPANFADVADTWVAALPTFGTEVNTVAGEVNTNASTASTAASTATTQADIATTQAGIATTKASEASASAAAALVSETNTAATYDLFDDRFLGAKASNPTLDNDGNALAAGAAYWDTTVNELRFWSGSAWLTANLTGTGYLTTGDVGVTVQGFSTNLSNFATKTAPAGTVVGTTDAQTLTNKTIRRMVQVISTNTTAVASNTYVLTATLTLTLPLAPTAGDWVEIVNRSGTTTGIVARNAQNIMGLAEDLTVNSTTASFTLTFADTTRGWVFND